MLCAKEAQLAPRASWCFVLRGRCELPSWRSCATSTMTAPSADIQKKKRRRKGFWKQTSNQRAVLELIGRRLGVEQLSDWYGVARSEVIKEGGQRLFWLYSSMADVLKAIYPNYPWETSRFVELGAKAPNGYWNDRSNLIQQLRISEERLAIKQPEDWYSVTLSDLKELGFPSTFSRLALADLLSEVYPNQKWDKVYLLKGKQAQQRRLELAVKSLFPGIEVIRNVRKEANLINPDTGRYLELDVYLPSLQLAFEYQELHHYTTAEYTDQPLASYQTRDKMKKEAALLQGITIITIPCWWDGTKASLSATIKKVRPDLLTEDRIDTGVAIPEVMPPLYIEKYVKKVEDIGVPTTACFFSRTDLNPTDWWVFEKYDGIRGFWNPLKKAFFSRYGKQLPIPQHIVNSMPEDLFLDGEIWFGRGRFDEAMKLANRVSTDEIDWTNFKYMVFDVPVHKGTYKERYSFLEEAVRERHAHNKFLEVAKMEVCGGMEHLEKFFQDVINKGGEGVILRDPTLNYEPGRSRGFLKHKKFRDAEAKIVGKLDSHRWECELPNGVRFAAAPGTVEFLKSWDPQIGDIVTFKYRGFLVGSGIPKMPVLYRIRKDITWEDCKINWKERKPELSGLPFRRSKTRHKAKGFWKNQENRRQFFLKLANELGFDPLQPSSWLEVTPEQIRTRQGSTLLAMYKGSLRKALTDTFPEIDFSGLRTRKVSEEKALPKGHWEDRQNRVVFFQAFAAAKGFDPSISSNWDSISKTSITQQKGGIALLKKYKGSLKRALLDTFPEFKNQEADSRSGSVWEEVNRCRSFFEEFAKERGFDPLSAESWQKVKAAEVKAKMGGAVISQLHGGVRNAVKVSFPELSRTE